MDIYQRNVMVGLPRPKSFSLWEQHHASSMSLLSHDSGGNGRKRTERRNIFNSRRINRSISRRQSVPVQLSHQLTKKKKSKIGTRGVLRTSLPIIRNQHVLDKSSKKNEEWDTLNMTPTYKLLPSYTLQPKSSIRNTSQTASTNKRKVTFGKTQISTFHDHSASFSEYTSMLWYKTSNHNQFNNDAQVCAKTIRLVMKHAAITEDTYNSSIGLTSPQVLEEYLRCPQEIIGIEHLLAGQSTARSSLKHYYRKCLLEAEQCRRQKKEGRGANDNADDRIRQRLRDYSRISSHMARERAAYIALLH